MKFCKYFSMLALALLALVFSELAQVVVSGSTGAESNFTATDANIIEKSDFGIYAGGLGAAPPTGGYTRSSFTSAYTPITVGGGATQIVTGTGPGDFSTSSGTANGDDGTAYVALPFSFTFAGTTYSAGTNYIGICTNGFAYFSTINTNASKITSTANTNLYTNATPNNTVAPYWDDLNLGPVNGVTGTVLYQTTGTPGSQVMTIQWGTFPSYFSGNARSLNFQIKLYEATGVVEFHYGSVAEGTTPGGNTLESASIGIEDGTGGVDRYIDAITGSGFTNYSMMHSGKFPAYNFRFTPGVPSPIPPGTYNVGISQPYRNLSEAVADINHRGISGPVTLNLTDAEYSTSAAFGNNIFPIVIGPIAGASATNTVTISKTGTAATIRSDIAMFGGGIGNQATATAVGSTNEPIIGIAGADFVTLQNLELLTLAGTTGADRGLLVFNSSATDGATNNTFRDIIIRLDRTNTNSIGIQTNTVTTPTSAAGANSNNRFQNLNVQNVYSGIYLLGNSTFPDTGVEVGTTSPTSFNSIGSAAANDIGNGALQTWGIRAANQSGVKIFNNEVRNVTVTGSVLSDGIFLELFQGVNEVNNNIVYNIRNASTSATTGISGIRASHATTGTHSARIFNNFVYGITSGYTGVASATRQIKGIFISGTGGSTSQDYEVANNSVRIDGSGSPNISSTAFEISTTTGPIHRVRNNIFSNFTGAQTSPAAHYTWFSTSATSIGPSGSVSNFNDLFIANTTQGFIGRGNTTDYANLAAWQGAMSQDLSSISADPSFSAATDLHLTAVSPAIDTGTTLGTITTDIDNQTRPNGLAYDIGADEFYPAPGILQLSSTTYGGNEGTSVTITVNRVSGSSGVVTVDVNLADVSATGGPLCGGAVDYINPGTITLTFPNLVTTQSFSVTLCSDSVIDPGETFTATLSNPTGGATLGSPTTATVTITDVPPPFAGTYTVGTSGTYPSLTNPGGIFEAINIAGTIGPVTIEIVSDLSGETGTHPLNQHPDSITVKSDSSLLRTISGSASAGLIRLNGADNVTFDGSIGGSGMFLRFRNTSTSAPTFVFLNDATNNIIRNSFVEGANTSTTSGTIVFSTSTGTLGNSNNSIIDSHIRDRSDAAGVPANAVYSSGSAGAPNGSNTISGCEIFNFTNSGVLVTSTGAGNGWTINPSSFYQTAARTTPLTGISIQGGNGHSIINNSIGGTAPGASGSHLATSSTFRGIDLTVGTVTPTSVQGNVIRNIRSTVTGFTASYGILVQAGRVNLGTVTGNTVGSSVFAERFEINGDSYGIRVISSSTVNVVNNTVNNFRTTSTPPTGQFYWGMSIEGTGGIHTVVNNTITNIANASAPDGSFNSQTTGLLVTATGVQTVRGNTISNIGSTSTTAPTANNNRVWGAILSGTAVGTVFEKNRISNIFGSSAGTGARADVITGLQSQSSANATYSNNMIETNGGASPSERFIFGVLDLSAGPATSNYYFNSVNIYGTAAGANNTYAFNRNNTAVVTLRNNILSNKRTGGTGFHVAIANTNTSPSGWSSSASDYNLLFNVNNSHIAQWLGSAGTNNRTLAVFQTDSGGDNNSLIGDPLFVSDSDLHLQTTSPAINTGIPAGGILDDIDNDTRPNGPAYDIGADEIVPTSANASISGRVMTANGEGIRNAVIMVTGGNLSEPIYAQTGTFGYYVIENLPVGNTYVVTVISKRFVFSNPTRIVTLDDNLSDLNFEADNR